MTSLAAQLLLLLLLVVTWCVAQDFEPANYARSCTPTSNPFLDNEPPSKSHPPPDGCGACLYLSTCTLYGGRTAGSSTGCEQFDSEQIGCCTHQRKNFNGCLMDPKEPIFTKVERTMPLSGSGKADFTAGSVVFTKASLLDSPSRYWSLVADALDEVALIPFTPQEKEDTFYKAKLECPHRGATPDGDPFREFSINPNKSSVAILGGTDPTNGGLRINAWFDIKVRCRYSVSIGYCPISFLCFEKCRLKDSIVLLKYSDLVPITVNVTFDAASSLLVVKPKVDLKLTWDNFEYSCGSDLVQYVSPLIGFFTGMNLQDRITSTVENSFKDVVSRDLLLPQEYRASEEILVGYRLTNLTFFDDSHILLTVAMNLSAVYPDGTRRYYEFPKKFHDLVPPSPDFSLLLQDKDTTPLLNGMRVSADFLTAMSGVTAMIYATVSNTTKISDANITYNMSIAGPELIIPESNSVEAVFPFGRLFAVCGSEPDVGKELINVNFDDVRGRVGIEYVNGDPTIGLRPGIIIQYQSINITGTRIIIKAPPFPLEGEVLQNAVSNSLANRQTYINDILRENPVQLPPMLLPYFPHPRLQATSVANSGGYFELLTSCSCSAPPPPQTNAEQAAAGSTACRAKSCGECVRAYPRCGWCDPLATGLNSTLSLTGKCEEGIMCSGGLVKPLTDTKLCPTVSGGYDDGCRFKCAELRIKRTRSTADAEVAAAAAARKRAAALPPVRELRCTDPQSPRDVDAVAAMAKRAATPYLVTVYSSPNCSMARAGTQMNAVVLAPTDGRCERSQGVFGLSNDALGPFYSITVNGPNNITALMMCNKNCTNCAASLNGEATNLCKVGKEGTLSWVLQENAGSCFGGIGSADSVGLMGVYLFSGDERCTDATRMPLPLQDDNDTSPVTVVGLGVRSRAAELKMCSNLNKNDVFRSSFAKISLSDASVLSLQMACKSGCINCGLEVSEEFAVRTCHTPPNLKKAAIDNEQPDAIPSLYVTELRTCTFTPPVDVKAMNMSMNMTANTPKPTADPLGDTNSATIGIAVSVAVVVAIAIVWGIIRCPAHSGVVDAGHGSMMAGFKAYMKRHSWTFGRPTPGFVWLFVFNIFAIVLAFIELMVWTIGRAIELIDANFLSSTLNINQKYDAYVNAGELSGRFAVWLESGNALMSVVIVIMILLLIDNMITRHHNHDAPNKPKRRNLFGLRMRKSVWFIVLAAHVAMLLVLPLQSTFGVTTSVEFDAQGNETLGKAKGTIETALGYATGLYMFNVVLSLFTNLLQLIPAGIMCGTVIYLADKGESIPNTRGAVVGRGVWVTAALVNITAHLIIPVALSAAVLIYLHRRGMAESFWVGLVWLVQWIAGLLLCALAFFRRVVPAPDRRGHVLVQSHVYFYAYLVVMVVTTLIEVFHMVASASELNFNVFLVLYRVTTFLIVTCFTRVWLQAYRPKYSRAALKERREKEHVDAAVADLEQAGDLAPEPSKAERMLAPVSAFCAKFGAYALLPVMGPVYIVSYLIEVGRPATDSLPRRRTWFFVGVIFFCVVLMDTFVHLVSSTPKEDAQVWFSQYEDQLYGIKWPDDDSGGDLLDPAFTLYATLRWTKFAIVFLCAILLIGLLIDDFRASRVSQDATQRSVWRAQQAGYVIITALYVAALTPAVPDYPSAANLRDILPECGYSFNHLVQNVYGGITGFVLTLFIINAIVPVLGIVMPSLSRTCKMIITGVLHANDGSGGHDDHSHGNCCSKMVHWHPEDGPAPPAVIDHAHMLFQMSMVLSPLLIGIALLLVFVFYGNSFTLIMILVNFIGPIVTAFALSPFSIGSSYLIAVWVFYFPSLMAIFIEIGIRFDYLTLEAVVEALGTGSFWMSVIFVCAEVCIANVIVADIVYLLIWSLYPEYSVLADQLPTPFMTMGGNTIALNSIDGNHSMNSGSTIGTITGMPTLQSQPSVAQFQTMNTGGMTMKFTPASRASEQIRELDDEFGGQRYGTKAPADAPFLTNSESSASVGSHGQLRSQPSTPSLGNSAATQVIDNPGGMFSCHICGNSYPSANDVFIHRAKRHPEVAHLSPPGANSGGSISPKNLY